VIMFFYFLAFSTYFFAFSTVLFLRD